MKINFKLIVATILLWVSNVSADYDTKVVSKDGKRTAIMGQGSHVNEYIADKIKTATANDTIRLGYYILDYASNTKYFHKAIVDALKNGAKVEIITEGKNTDLKAAIDGNIKEYRYRNANEFLYGDNNAYEDGNITSLCSVHNINRIEHEVRDLRLYTNELAIYKVDRAGDSEDPSSIYHRKVALLDINGKREIIISTANVRPGGETDWQAAITLNGNHYESQWKWWNKVLDTDKCFARFGSSEKNCRLGNGGYEYNHEGWTTSFISDNESSYNTMAHDWLSKMLKPKYGSCTLSMLMKEVSNLEVFNEIKRIASIGCEVEIIYQDDYNEGDQKINKYIPDTKNIKIIQKDKVHTKMILWKGNYSTDDFETMKYSWVGSMNATTAAIRRHDETMLRVRGDRLYDAFKKYFDHVKSLPTKK